MSRYDARWLQSRYISLLAPPLLDKKLQRTSCKWWQFISGTETSAGNRITAQGTIYLFSKKEFWWEKSHFVEDQLESDLGCWKIETRDNSKRVRLVQTMDGRGQWLWCGQDLGEEGTPCRADLDWRHPSWLDAEMMTVTERIREDPECQTQDWYMRVR